MNCLLRAVQHGGRRGGGWWRSYGNELWQFDAQGFMNRREASINDMAVTEDERCIFGPRPGTGYPARGPRSEGRARLSGRRPQPDDATAVAGGTASIPGHGVAPGRAQLRGVASAAGGRADWRSGRAVLGFV